MNEKKPVSAVPANPDIIHCPRFASQLLSRKEAAEYLGVSDQTLAAWKASGRYNLPCIKVGRLAKYRKGDLDAFIERRAC